MSQLKITQIYKKNKMQVIAFLCNFILATLFFGGMIRKSYNADTITYMVYAQDDADVRIRAGRYLVALVDVINCRFGIKTTDYMPIGILLSIIFLAGSLTLLQSVFSRFFGCCGNGNSIDNGITKDNGSTLYYVGYGLTVALTFCNVLYIEYFMFTEMTLFYVFAYFFATVAVHLYIKNKRLLAYLLFTVTVCIYQLTVVYAAIALLFYYMLSNEFTWSKKAVAEEFFGLALPFSLGLINMIAIKIVGTLLPEFASKKPYASEALAEKLHMVAASLEMFAKNSYTLLPNLFLSGIILVFSVGLAMYLIAKTHGGLGVLYYALVLAISVIAIYVIPVLGEGFNFQPRMSFLLYVLQGLLLVTVMVLLSSGRNGGQMVFAGERQEMLVKAVSVVIIAYMVLQVVSCSFIISGRYVSNTLDKTYSKIILEEIEKYEEDTGVTVTKFAAINDAYAPAYYEESRIHYEQINERIMGQSTRSMFEAFWGRHFDAAGMPNEIINEHFADKNWDYFDVNEQLVIVDDTAYLCVY